MALKNNCSLTVGKAQYGAGQETEGHGARNKSKVVRSFADSNKKTLMKALPKRQKALTARAVFRSGALSYAKRTRSPKRCGWRKRQIHPILNEAAPEHRA